MNNFLNIAYAKKRSYTTNVSYQNGKGETLEGIVTHNIKNSPTLAWVEKFISNPGISTEKFLSKEFIKMKKNSQKVITAKPEEKKPKRGFETISPVIIPEKKPKINHKQIRSKNWNTDIRKTKKQYVFREFFTLFFPDCILHEKRKGDIYVTFSMAFSYYKNYINSKLTFKQYEKGMTF